MRLQVPESLTTSLLLVVVLAEVVGANPPKADTHPFLPSFPFPVITVNQLLVHTDQPPMERSTTQEPAIVPGATPSVEFTQPSPKPSSPLKQQLLHTRNALDALWQEQ